MAEHMTPLRASREPGAGVEKPDSPLRLPASWRLDRAKGLADLRYCEPLSVAVLAHTAQMSPSHFIREFRRAFGATPHQYLMHRRLEHAAVLLRTTDHPVKEICAKVGWRSVGSFTTSFGQKYGVSPGAYRTSLPPADR